MVGPRPLRSPSLADYPQCDAEVQRLADELWADCDGKTVREHRLGKERSFAAEPRGRSSPEWALLRIFMFREAFRHR